MWSKERFSIIRTTMRLKGVGNETSLELRDLEPSQGKEKT